MKTYLIGYDLNRPGQNYNELYNAIKRYNYWCHCLDSTWIIKSDSTAEEIRNYLVQFLDSNDKILVAKLAGEAAWQGMSQEVSKWLKENL